MTTTNLSRPSLSNGRSVIADYAARLDSQPGVYRMLSASGDILYIGKAKNLKNRVTSYTQTSRLPTRLQRMVAETHSMESIVTTTESEALLLESNMIRKLEPRYNILLKDDKMFPYILVAKDHPYPQISKHRGARKQQGTYFGPFASGYAVRETLAAMQRVFLLRSCSDSYFANRSRPCPLYQIKRCSAPCVGHVSEEDYARLVKQAEDFLYGRSSGIQEELAEKMNAASAAMEYEKAALLRDRIKALTHVQSKQDINVAGLNDADVLAVHSEGGQACVQVFFFRGNRNLGNRSFFPKNTASFDEAAILEAFIAQFYAGQSPPEQVLLSHALPEDSPLLSLLQERMPYTVRFSVPKRGHKADIVEQALRNAKRALAIKAAEKSSQARLLEGIARVFSLPEPPSRIEIYDNSHLQGRHAMGAMVVAGSEGFIKKEYRKFGFDLPEGSVPDGGDDYAMMHIMLTRRFKRGLKEGKPEQWPQLLLIDGGAGQIAAAENALAALGVDDVTVIGVAKGEDRNAGRERFFRVGEEPFSLPMDDPVLYYIQRLRDEAHRFAIGAHRTRRGNAMKGSPLDGVPGVGAGRKKLLLQHFGSGKAVQQASLADLMRVKGINASLARTIFAHFNPHAE